MAQPPRPPPAPLPAEGSVTGAGLPEARGGVRVGYAGGIAARKAPPLGLERVSQACDDLQRGRDCYRAVVTLRRASAADLDSLFAATRAKEANVRWARVWTMAPFIARASRDTAGRQRTADNLGADLTAMHIVAQQRHRGSGAARRILERAREPLLRVLLTKLDAMKRDTRRCGLVAGMIAAVETSETPLRTAIGATFGDAALPELLPLLEIREPDPDRPAMSTGSLGRTLGTRLASLEPGTGGES